MSQNKNDLIEKIDSICPEGQRNKHSYFQLQYFVIGKEPTVQAKLQACKRELLSRRHDIEALSVEMEELLDKRRLEQLAIEKIKKEVPENDEVAEIQKRQCRRRQRALESRIEYCQREIAGKEDEANFLIGLYDKLTKIEPQKDWDSLEVQAEYWNAKLTREIESRLMMGQLPNIEDFKTVMSLPAGMPIKDITNRLIEDKSKQVKNLPAQGT